MSAVTKWDIRGMPATAYSHSGSSAEPEWLPFLIDNLKIAFYANGAIAEYGYFGCYHEFLRLV